MLWDLNEGKHLYTLDGGDVINSLCFSPNRYWLCAATGPSIKIWVIVHSNTTTLHIYVYKVKEHLQGHTNLILCLSNQRARISTKIYKYTCNIIVDFLHPGSSVFYLLYFFVFKSFWFMNKKKLQKNDMVTVLFNFAPAFKLFHQMSDKQEIKLVWPVVDVLKKIEHLYTFLWYHIYWHEWMDPNYSWHQWLQSDMIDELW